MLAAVNEGPERGSCRGSRVEVMFGGEVGGEGEVMWGVRRQSDIIDLSVETKIQTESEVFASMLLHHLRLTNGSSWFSSSWFTGAETGQKSSSLS